MELLFLDASTPLTDYPVGIVGLAFYIGGDTPHVWTLAEESACPYDLRLPIFVRSDPQNANIGNDVLTCLMQLAAFSVPKGSLVALDSETSIDPPYVEGFFRGMQTGGYTLIVYGSVSTVFGNNNPDGLYWGADWTGVPHLYPGTQETQYVSFQSYDESVALSTLPFWRKVPAVTPLPTGTVQSIVSVSTQAAEAQSGFSFCTKCGAVYFRAAGNNVCAAGGIHTGGPADGTSYDYTLVHV